MLAAGPRRRPMPDARIEVGAVSGLITTGDITALKRAAAQAYAERGEGEKAAQR